MLTGVYAARNAANGCRVHDTWSVNVEQGYHEEQEEAGHAGKTRERVITTLTATAAVTRRSAERCVETAFLPIDPFSLGLSLAIVTDAALLLATLPQLLRGGPPSGADLSLLGQFLPGYRVSRAGTLLGLIEGGSVGFLLGWAGAHLRNACVWLYARVVQRRAESQQRRDLLDKV